MWARFVCKIMGALPLLLICKENLQKRGFHFVNHQQMILKFR